MSTERAFLILRYTLIIATAYLLLVEQSFALTPLAPFLLVAVAFISNIAIGVLPPSVTSWRYFALGVIVGDTLWISLALLASGHFAADFFFLYFFVLLLAALGEKLWLIAVAAVAVCAAYLYVLSAMGAEWSLWTSPSLIRIPFLFAAAAFYGHMVERTRHERRRAQEADRIKSEFLGTISHELRTPLSVILGYLDLLLDGEFGALPPAQKGVLQRVRAAGEKLHGFLSQLLDVSRLVNRIQSGHEAVNCTEVSLDALLADVRNEFSATTSASVRWPQLGDVPPLYSDREKISTILRNLVENGVKYSNNGVVRVDAHWHQSTDMIEIKVTDNGIGIAGKDLSDIFDPFCRAPGAIKSTAPGVGLGLYIVKQFVELLNGKIEVESEKGVGSTFSVQFPRRMR